MGGNCNMPVVDVTSSLCRWQGSGSKKIGSATVTLDCPGRGDMKFQSSREISSTDLERNASVRKCDIVANDTAIETGTYYPMTVKKHKPADAAEQSAVRLHVGLLLTFPPSSKRRLKASHAVDASSSFAGYKGQCRRSSAVPRFWGHVGFSGAKKG